MSDWVRGVINLRGKVIPVIDLRLRFGLPQIQDTKQTCIIVVDVKFQEYTTLVGILVDTVSEVVNITDAEVDRAINFGANVNNSFILGAAKVKGGVKILLDMGKILSGEELTTFTRLGG
jgi:purine-binding chemotaxis protein CheW